MAIFAEINLPCHLEPRLLRRYEIMTEAHIRPVSPSAPGVKALDAHHQVWGPLRLHGDFSTMRMLHSLCSVARYWLLPGKRRYFPTVRTSWWHMTGATVTSLAIKVRLTGPDSYMSTISVMSYRPSC